MPFTYTTPATVKSAITAVKSDPVGILINLEDKTVTWKYKAFDSAGKLVKEGEFTETFAALGAEDANYAEVYTKIKAHANLHHVDAGMPTGGVVS